MIVTGGLMLSTNVIYYLLIPSKMMMIRFEDRILMFKLGWCFWLVLVAGKCQTLIYNVTHKMLQFLGSFL